MLRLVGCNLDLGLWMICIGGVVVSGADFDFVMERKFLAPIGT